MKMIKKCTLVIAAAVLSTAVLVSCGAALNEDLYNETVGKRTETIPPANVSELEANIVNNAVSLKWVNPTDKDFYGLIISVSPAEGSLKDPMAFVNDDAEKIPTVFTVNDLTTNVSYTFTIKTFDYNMNYSSGVSVTAKPEGENATATDSFYGTENVIGYKNNKIALDFGYCEGPTDKTVELIATTKMNMASTAFSDAGNFSLVSYEPTGDVNIGDKIKITVKYTPPATPSWDEEELAIGNTGKYLTAIGSSFKQPNSASFKKTEKDTNGNDIEYGVKLWLRADMITSSDIKDDKVKRIPDYSGRNLHANCTDTTNNYRYAAVYVGSDSIFNGLPSINFNQNSSTDIMKAQYMSFGNYDDPIISSEKGTTTFIIMRPDNYGTTQSYLSSNYGMSYPTLWNYYRQYNESAKTWGLTVKGGGLYGTYRFPCETDSTTDPTNKWYTNDYNNATSICMIFDNTIKPDQGVKSGVYCDYPSNIRMQIKGQERLVSYLYSSSTTKDYKPYNNYYNGQYTCIRADGRPVSDAKGHRYGTFTNYVTPSTTSTLAAATNWKASIADNSKGREYDWAYTTTPQNYQKEDGSWANRDNSLQSTATSETSNSSGAYFYNWISNEDRRNGIIYNVILGADNVNTTYTKARIAEVIMFDYALSDEEITIVNNYIYYRYGIGSAQ